MLMNQLSARIYKKFYLKKLRVMVCEVVISKI
jgi:hypothetical protein